MRILVEIIERHADEAAFLWERRERACRSPLFDLSALADIDRRLEANLEGLVIAGQVGLEKSVAAAARGTPAELFTAVHVAAELGDAMALARLLVAADRGPGGEAAVVAALAWLSSQRAASVLGELLADECPPSLQRLGIAAHAARRQDPGARLDRALRSPDAALRGRALRAAAQLGRRDLLGAVREEARSGGETEGWAAWSAVLLGDTDAVRSLWRAAEQGGPVAVAACDLAARCAGADEVMARLEALSRSPATLPVALAGAASRGDPSCIPWILDVVEREPVLSRRAAWVYATITGAALGPPLAVRTPTVDPPDDLLGHSALDPWEDLPSPAPTALRSHWEETRHRFAPGERRLGGRAVEPGWLAECLRTGVQPWRASAAIELSLGPGRDGLFPVHAPGYMQVAHLARLTAPAAEPGLARYSRS